MESEASSLLGLADVCQAYFFAVVSGLAVGELIFARLNVQVGGLGRQEHH